MHSGSLVSPCAVAGPAATLATDLLAAYVSAGRYHRMPCELLSLIAAKEKRGEVHFLKRDDLEYNGYPGAEDSEAYSRVSTWLTGLGYGPLCLDDRWWQAPKRRAESASWQHCRSGLRVVRNYRAGFHEYAELLELLTQSCGDRLRATMGDDLPAR